MMPVVCIVLLPGMFSPGLSDSWGWCAVLKGIVQTKLNSPLLWQIESEVRVENSSSALKCFNICIRSGVSWMERIPPNKWRGEWWTPKKKTTTCLHTVIEIRTFDYCMIALAFPVSFEAIFNVWWCCSGVVFNGSSRGEVNRGGAKARPPQQIVFWTTQLKHLLLSISSNSKNLPFHLGLHCSLWPEDKRGVA